MRRPGINTISNDGQHSRICRRSVLAGLSATATCGGSSLVRAQNKPQLPRGANGPVITGAASAVAASFKRFAGKRIGLIANQTSLVESEHLVDIISRTSSVKLVAIFAPEHGFRGAAKAGASVRNGRDAKTGVPMFSLYGATKKPTPDMLRGVDLLIFDIQDVGVRSYTYISTMGLAMQAAADARIPFVVLDRPNPIGGEDVSGFVLEPALKSFVGQYPIPITHAMTVGELANMIKGERWLTGLSSLDLTVVACTGWTRSMRWPSTGLTWVATSPNIPTFETALMYPGIGLVGDTLVNEGRGTPAPFTQFGAPWFDAGHAPCGFRNTAFAPDDRARCYGRGNHCCLDWGSRGIPQAAPALSHVFKLNRARFRLVSPGKLEAQPASTRLARSLECH